jgi:hypothetical protein
VRRGGNVAWNLQGGNGNTKIGDIWHTGANGQLVGRVSAMCLDCGCGELNESHGDSRHITMDSIQAAAQASEISVEDAIRNISDGLRQSQGSSGQTSSSSSGSD